jgi:5-methylcytosine-specific restriction endonuclease McrA
MTPEEKREHKRLASQQWREDNREHHREYQRNYRLEHQEECKARNDKWNDEHPEEVAGYKAKWNENNPGANNESSANWRRSHPEHKSLLTHQRRARILGSGGVVTTKEWEDIKALYGPSCLRCKEIKPLTMDHVIPISVGGSHIADNLQPLCLSCNSWKKDKTIDYRPNLEEEKAA